MHYAYPSPIKLMTNNGFGILLILVEKIKRGINQTWEGLQRTTGIIWKNERIDMIAKEERSWTIHRKKIENERIKDEEPQGRERKKILERI